MVLGFCSCSRLPGAARLPSPCPSALMGQCSPYVVIYKDSGIVSVASVLPGGTQWTRCDTGTNQRLRKEGLKEIQSVEEGKAWHQEPGARGHAAPAVREQKWMLILEDFFSYPFYPVWDPSPWDSAATVFTLQLTSLVTTCPEMCLLCDFKSNLIDNEDESPHSIKQNNF